MSAAYGKMRISVIRKDPACLIVAAGGEKALNKYAAAYDRWNKCIQDLGCDTSSIEPDLQADWAGAGLSTAHARNRLDGLKRVGQIPRWSPEMPRTAAGVHESIYGAAEEIWCGENEKPSAADACSRLKQVLRDGVASDEVDDLDEAVKDLNSALGLEPTKK